MGDDKEKFTSNVITGKFKSDKATIDLNEKPAKTIKPNSKQSNPIYRKLFKFFHVELSNHNGDYKSLSTSRFKPEDLE